MDLQKGGQMYQKMEANTITNKQTNTEKGRTERCSPGKTRLMSKEHTKNKIDSAAKEHTKNKIDNAASERIQCQ
jgi:hypothetical protein